MCSQMDDPTAWQTQPKVTRPRVYELSGTPRGSIALAVLGDLLTAAELAEDAGLYPLGNTVETLREARDRVAAAEATR